MACSGSKNRPVDAIRDRCDLVVTVHSQPPGQVGFSIDQISHCSAKACLWKVCARLFYTGKEKAPLQGLFLCILAEAVGVLMSPQTRIFPRV
jgi:hypothetical protein